MAPVETSLPPVPRPITPTARRRAWTEPRVRGWWLAAIVPMGLFIYVCFNVIADFNRFRDLVARGVAVQAVVSVAGYEKGHRLPPDTAVTLSYQIGDTTRQASGTLLARTEMIRVGETIEIRVDPTDPQRWTDHTTPPQLAPRMMGPLAILPFIAVALLAGLLARRRLMKTWREGVAVQALVIEVLQTALAPKSTLVRCTIPTDRDGSVLGVYLPHSKGIPVKGETLWLLRPPARSTGAVAAEAFI